MGIFSNRSRTSSDGVKPVSSATPHVAASGGACVEVSATDGPMPETADHFTRIGSTGASTVEVSLVNCHAVGDEELLELIEQEIHSVASECGLTVTSISRA